MHRSRVARSFASLFAIWFAASLTEPAFLHACPMHGAHTASHALTPSAHATHGGTAHRTSHGATDDTPRAPHPASHCTCLGSCTASSAGAVLPGTPVLPQQSPTFSVAAPIPAVVACASSATPFLLPYANGPPAPARIA